MEEVLNSKKVEISVIIVTKDRPEALAKISLPSLVSQTFRGFEVIIFDASSDNKTEEITKKFTGLLDIRYSRAPRVGIPSQRNDVVKEASGAIIFFIDDDLELGKDNIEKTVEAFKKKNISGCAPPVISGKETVSSGKKRKKSIVRKILRIVFGELLRSDRRIVLSSGKNIYPSEDKASEAQWLSGCAMAFRKEIFADHSFNEKLQRFGNYALGEDVDFTYRLFLEGHRLEVIEAQPAIHQVASNGRLSPHSNSASSVFNFYLIWRNIIFPRNRWSLIVYFLSLLWEAILDIKTSISIKSIGPIKGYFQGLKAALTLEWHLHMGKNLKNLPDSHLRIK